MKINLYGLKAILIAHVLLNTPFATRLFVQNLNNIPKDYYEICKKLGFRLRNRIIWNFEHGLHSNKKFSGRYETILWFTKSNNYYDECKSDSAYEAYKSNALGEVYLDNSIFPATMILS